MTYIQYHALDNQWQEGYLIKQDENFSYICHPLCYDWLKKMNQLDNIHLIHTHVLTNDFLEYRSIHSPFSTLDSWIFSFSLKQEDIPYLHYTLTFFQCLSELSHLSLSKRLEYALFRHSIFIPKGLLGRLLLFILNNYKEDRERIRLMFHPLIQKYIEGVERRCTNL